MTTFAAGILQGMGDAKVRSDQSALRRRELGILEAQANQGAASPPLPGPPRTRQRGAIDPLFALIDRTEGGGDYDTLYGYSQRDGGQFGGTKVSEMSLGDLYGFSDPSGSYGQWVAGQNNGTVATPMGRHQIVGSTLRGAAKELGLSDDTRFSRETQNSIARHLADKRLASASDMPGKMEALRNEWAGFRNVRDADLQAAISAYEGGGSSPAAPGASGQGFFADDRSRPYGAPRRERGILDLPGNGPNDMRTNGEKLVDGAAAGARKLWSFFDQYMKG